MLEQVGETWRPTEEDKSSVTAVRDSVINDGRAIVQRHIPQGRNDPALGHAIATRKEQPAARTVPLVALIITLIQPPCPANDARALQCMYGSSPVLVVILETHNFVSNNSCIIYPCPLYSIIRASIPHSLKTYRHPTASESYQSLEEHNQSAIQGMSTQPLLQRTAKKVCLISTDRNKNQIRAPFLIPSVR